jgi:hypothetical protein
MIDRTQKMIQGWRRAKRRMRNLIQLIRPIARLPWFHVALVVLIDIEDVAATLQRI